MNNLIKAADDLAGAIDDERNMVCQDFGMQQDASLRTDTALTAYRTARNEQGGVKVKPLVWCNKEGSAIRKSICGFYQVGFSHWGKWYLTTPLKTVGDQYHSLGSAKRAAQADYETRIRSALEE